MKRIFVLCFFFTTSAFAGHDVTRGDWIRFQDDVFFVLKTNGGRGGELFSLKDGKGPIQAFSLFSETQERNIGFSLASASDLLSESQISAEIGAEQLAKSKNAIAKVLTDHYGHKEEEVQSIVPSDQSLSLDLALQEIVRKSGELDFSYVATGNIYGNLNVTFRTKDSQNQAFEFWESFDRADDGSVDEVVPVNHPLRKNFDSRSRFTIFSDNGSLLPAILPRQLFALGGAPNNRYGIDWSFVARSIQQSSQHRFSSDSLSFPIFSAELSYAKYRGGIIDLLRAALGKDNRYISVYPCSPLRRSGRN